MNVIELRIAYKKETGDPDTPINNGHFDKLEYIIWLEERLLKLHKLKTKLIPFENEL